jgi:hypothetical protein
MRRASPWSTRPLWRRRPLDIISTQTRSPRGNWMGSRAERRPLSISRNTLLFGSGLVLLIIRILFWLYQTPVLGHDQYGLLWEARRLLSGVELYGSQLAEPNPPFIIWFSVVPVVISTLLHITETTAFHLLVFAMISASTLWSARIARRYSSLSDFRIQLLLVLAIVAVESPIRVLLFGQRENLLVICVIPYAIAIALEVTRTLPVYERIALGTVAGIGVCFKPHHVLVIVGIEIAVVAMSRSLRHLLSPELLAAILTCLLYIGAIAVYTPRYLTQSLPLLRDTYWALGSHSITYLALHQVPEMCCVLLLFLAAFSVLKNGRDRRAIICLLFASIFASIAYDIQHTSWGYHLYPAIAFTALAAALLAILAARTFLMSHDAAPSPLLFGVVAVILCTFVIFEQRTKPDPALPSDGGAFAGLTKGDTVYIFSTGAEFFPVAYRRNLQWGSRFGCLWLLPSLIQNSPGGRALADRDLPFKALSPGRVAELATMQRTEVAADLDYWEPSVVLVQRCPCDFIYSDSFDMVEWFSRNAGFQKSWSHYYKQSSIPGFDIYKRTH